VQYFGTGLQVVDLIIGGKINLANAVSRQAVVALAGRDWKDYHSVVFLEVDLNAKQGRTPVHLIGSQKEAFFGMDPMENTVALAHGEQDDDHGGVSQDFDVNAALAGGRGGWVVVYSQDFVGMAALAGGKVDLGWVVGWVIGWVVGWVGWVVVRWVVGWVVVRWVVVDGQIAADPKAHGARRAVEQEVEVLIIHGE